MPKPVRDLPGFIVVAIVGAVAFGILHDLVTAHVSVEYFSVHHPKVIDSTRPIPLAFAWGVLATWWVGLAAGLAIGVANIAGRVDSVPWAHLRKAYARCLVGLWISSMTVLAGVFALGGLVPLAKRGLSFESDRRLMAVAVTHLWSYAGGAALILALVVWIALVRLKPQP